MLVNVREQLQTLNDVTFLDKSLVCFSTSMANDELALKDFLKKYK